MLVACNRCETSGIIDENLISDSGRALTCKKCGYTFVIMTSYIDDNKHRSDTMIRLVGKECFDHDLLEEEVCRAIINSCNKLESTKPRCLEILYKRGKSHYRLGNYDLSLRDLSKALELQPKYPEIHNMTGEVYFKLEEIGKAIYFFNESSNLDLYYINPIINRARLYMTIEKYDLYQEDIERAWRLDKKDALLHSLILERASKRSVLYKDQILNDIKRVLSVDPSNHEALSLKYKLNDVLGNKNELHKDVEDIINNLKKQIEGVFPGIDLKIE